MRILKETDIRFINIEKKIGLFVLIAIIGIVLIIAFIGIQQDIFTPKTRIYFIADSGQGISEGQAVKLSGFRIGRVKRLSLDDVAKVKVELSINTRYMKWIKTDSKARLIKEGLIGDSIIEIIPGSANAKQIHQNDLIAFEREKGLSEMAEELKDEIKPALTGIGQAINYLNDPQGDIKQTLKNIKKLSADLSSTKRHLNTLLQNTDKNISDTTRKVDSLIDSAKSTATSTDNVVKKIDKEFPALLDSVNKSLENIQKTTGEIKKATEKIAPQIPSTLENVREVVEKGSEIADETKETVGAIKKMWPIRSFISQPDEKKLKMDSYE